MDDNEFKELFSDFLNYYDNSDSVSEDKKRLENSRDIITDFIDLLNESLSNHDRYRASWLIVKYGTKDNFKLLFEWINHGIATDDSEGFPFFGQF
ncbi:MAG: hypothetical protein LPK25_01560 [Cyclobacteriaceae bacterium]|nr:hypothetical protein [Cyclobacteriaceae bacterium]